MIPEARAGLRNDNITYNGDIAPPLASHGVIYVCTSDRFPPSCEVAAARLALMSMPMQDSGWKRSTVSRVITNVAGPSRCSPRDLVLKAKRSFPTWYFRQKCIRVSA